MNTNISFNKLGLQVRFINGDFKLASHYCAVNLKSYSLSLSLLTAITWTINYIAVSAPKTKLQIIYSECKHLMYSYVTINRIQFAWVHWLVRDWEGYKHPFCHSKGKTLWFYHIARLQRGWKFIKLIYIFLFQNYTYIKASEKLSNLTAGDISNMKDSAFYWLCISHVVLRL
jgi:hypothetical protein